MTAEILHIMEERQKYKNLHTVEGDKNYKEIKHSIQKLCREGKYITLMTSERKLKCWISVIINYYTRKLRLFNPDEVEFHK